MALKLPRLRGPIVADADMLARLESKFESDPDAFIAASKRLTARDFELIGTFIQVYCFAELSARQIIELIDSATPRRDAHNATRLASHDVFPKLGEAAKRLQQTGSGNLKDTLIRAAETIEMHRPVRHTFAHWAVRSVERGRAYLLLSKHAQEGKRRHGRMIGAGQSHYGILGVSTLRSELGKLEQHTQNLSVAALKMSSDPLTLQKMAFI
jgi:hypothetical protein